MKIQVAFFLLMCNFGFSQTKNDSITIIFKKHDFSSVKVTNERNKNQYFTYCEYDSYLESALAPHNQDKDDTIKIGITNPKMYFKLKWNNSTNVSKAVFYKNDIVEISYPDGVPELKITNRIVKPNDLNIEKNFNLHFPEMETVDIEKEGYGKYKKALKKHREASKLFEQNLIQHLNEWLQQNLISEEVYKVHLNSIKFQNIKSNDDLDLTDFNSELKDPDLIIFDEYRIFLQQYVSQHLKLKYNFRILKNANFKVGNKIQKEVKFKEEDFEDAFQKIETSSLFSDKAKEYLLFQYLNKIANKNPKIVSSYFEKFKNHTSNTKLLADFQKSFLLDLDNLKKISDHVIVLDVDKNQLSLEKIIEQYKGKMIYIDFWASWCGPCRMGLPKSRALHEEFKDVVFLYLSTDSNFDAWKKANEYEKLTQNSYFVVNKGADYLKQLEIDFIPRYLIISESGEISDKNAPRPESEEIKEIFRKK